MVLLPTTQMREDKTEAAERYMILPPKWYMSRNADIHDIAEGTSGDEMADTPSYPPSVASLLILEVNGPLMRPMAMKTAPEVSPLSSPYG